MSFAILVNVYTFHVNLREICRMQFHLIIQFNCTDTIGMQIQCFTDIIMGTQNRRWRPPSLANTFHCDLEKLSKKIEI